MERLTTSTSPSTTSSGACRNPACPFEAQVDVLEFAGVRIVPLCPGCFALVEAWEADAERHRLIDLYKGRLDAGPRLRAFSLATFPRDEPGRAAIEAVGQWLSGYLAGERRNLILWGQIGAGKSGLAYGLARELVERHVVETSYVVWRDLLFETRNAYSENRRPDLAYRAVAVLVLDDLGAERPTEWALEELASLVEYRYQRVLPTIVTTNYRLSELAERLGRSELTQGRRIVSRLQEGAMQVEVKGRDRRA